MGGLPQGDDEAERERYRSAVPGGRSTCHPHSNLTQRTCVRCNSFAQHANRVHRIGMGFNTGGGPPAAESAKSEPIKYAGPKACASKSRPGDAEWRRFA